MASRGPVAFLQRPVDRFAGRSPAAASVVIEFNRRTNQPSLLPPVTYAALRSLGFPPEYKAGGIGTLRVYELIGSRVGTVGSHL